MKEYQVIITMGAEITANSKEEAEAELRYNLSYGLGFEVKFLNADDEEDE